MKIAIDTTPLENSHKDRGTGVYVKNIVEALEKYDNRNSYTYFTRGQNIPKNVNLVYYPYFDIFFHTLPIFHSYKFVVTVHDLIPIVFPEKFPRGIRGNIMWNLQKIALKKSSRAIASSISTKNDLIRFVGLDSSLVDVVGLAPSTIYTVNNHSDNSDEIFKKYNISGKYILYVGDINWNKNVTGLVSAFSKLIMEKEYADYKLLLAGKVFIDEKVAEIRSLRNQIETLNISKSIITPGYVDDHDLKIIYKHCGVYVQPSHYEGFGLPVLEAMASGAIVSAADNSSLQEISGPALRFDSGSPDSIYEVIKQVLHMPIQMRDKQINEQNKWVSGFTWQKTVKQIMEVYEKTI
ncbi:glycosyltransferase family 4 protein [Patescibacteria group bacterium]